tara:strand:- start:173 stop:1138 length:966 start_codon:yes stop_codon:yes gene_type:complete
MRWVFNIRFATFLLILLCCRLGDSDEAAEHEEAVSLVSGYFANFEAVESFDVLWTCESQWVGENGYIEEGVSSGRLIVDPEKSRCCSVLDRSRTELVATKDGAIEKRSMALDVVVSDGKESWSRSVPQPASRMKSTKIGDVLRHNSTVFLPAIGVVAFPVFYGQAPDFRDLIDGTRYGGVRYKLMGEGVNSQTVSYETPVAGVFTIKRTTALDSSSFTPTKYSETAVYPDGKVFPKVRESYRFTEHDGLYLPVGISGEKHNKKTVGETKVKGIEMYDVRIRWFSINEPMGEEYFSPHILNDIKRITDLVDLKLLDEEVETK